MLTRFGVRLASQLASSLNGVWLLVDGFGVSNISLLMFSGYQSAGTIHSMA